MNLGETLSLLSVITIVASGLALLMGVFFIKRGQRVLWGAFVRISGAGAGCGEHWPLCNGVVIPESPTLHTIIEYSHRLTSSLSGFLTLILTGLVFWHFPKKHQARLGAILALILIVLEGLLGGLQVTMGLTADSTNPARGLIQSLHLVNTFALLGALLMTAVWVSGGKPIYLRGQGKLVWSAVVILLGMLVLNMAGAVTALGDLLFRPTGTPGLETLRSDFSVTATILQNLRVIHPLFAVLVSAALIMFASRGAKLRPSPEARNWKIALHALISFQILAGMLNITLKAPGWMQLTHLFLALTLWLATLMLCYTLLTSLQPSLRSSSNRSSP